MNDAAQEGENPTEITQQNVADDTEMVAAARAVTNNLPGTSKMNWNGYKTSLKRKSNTAKSSSKKQKAAGEENSDHEEVVSIADDGADAPRASPEADDSPSSSDDSSPGPDESDEDGSSSSGESTPQREMTVPQPRKPAQVPVYSRFDPGVGDSVTFSLPNKEMTSYASRRFTEYCSDRKLKETVCEECPVPVGVPGLLLPHVDDYIPEIFRARKQEYGKPVDDNWTKVQSRIIDVMGPLTKVWTVLDHIREDESADLDLFQCLDLVEKTITLLGQANISVAYFRRLNILYKLTRDIKKAKTLLRRHNVEAMKDQEKLFGKDFYKTLTKSAKVSKISKEISSQLGEAKQKFRKGKHSNTGQGQEQSANQPFQQGPSRGGRGGRKVSVVRRGKANGNRGKTLFKICNINKQFCEKNVYRNKNSRSSKSSLKLSVKTGRVSGRIYCRRVINPGEFTSRGASLSTSPCIFAKTSGGGDYSCVSTTGDV